MTEDTASKPPVRVGKTRLISMSDLDRRTRAAQAAIETRDAIVADLGGADRLSTLERIAAEHASLAAAVTQDGYSRWLQGQEVSLAELATIQNCYLRVASTLGFARRAKDVTPDLGSYLQSKVEASDLEKTADGPMGLDTSEAPSGRPEPTSGAEPT